MTKNNDDFLIDENGNYKTIDPETASEYIKTQITKALSTHKEKSLDIKTVKEEIAKTLNRSLSFTNNESSSSVVSVKTRWENMGIRGRLEWYFMKIFFKTKVKAHQKIIRDHNVLIYSILSLLEEKDAESLDSYDYFRDLNLITKDYPNWCHPYPKSVFDTTTNIFLKQPLDYIEVKLEVKE